MAGSPRVGSAASVRENGAIPAVLYGKGVETKSFQVNYSEFQKLFRDAGESTLITLTLEGEDFNVLVKDVQYEPLKDSYQHLDFYVVRMDEKITAEVELVFVGTAPAVKDEGGTLVKNLDALDITCLPADLPHEIEVDISSLATFDDAITVADLKLSDKLEPEQEETETIALVAPPRSDEEMEALDSEVEMDVESVEGVTKESDVEGEEGAEDGDAKESESDEGKEKEKESK